MHYIISIRNTLKKNNTSRYKTLQNFSTRVVKIEF